MLINLIYDASAQAAPQSFRDGMQAAVNILQSTFTNNITINIAVSYGNAADETVSFGNFNPDIPISYSDLYSALSASASSVDDATSIYYLPPGPTIEGQSTFEISTAQEKALGLYGSREVSGDPVDPPP